MSSAVLLDNRGSLAMNKRDQALANRVAQVANEQYFPDRYGWMDIDHRTLAYYDNNPITPEVREAARGVAITRAAAEGYLRIVAEGQYDSYTTSIVFRRETQS